MASQNHIHTYVKFKSRPGYFRCAAPDCTHFLIKEAVKGKYSLCPDCGRQFIIDTDNIRLAKPRCLNCRDSKKAKAFKVGQEALSKIVRFDVGDGAED